MKKIFNVVLLGVMLLVGCENVYRDELAQIHKELDEINARLDAFCEETNSNIAALQAMIAALQAKDYVTGVVPVMENGEEVGYQITFEKSGTITIYHGKDGADGADGADGKDGKDGYTPQIGIKKDADGIYYWTLDGEWLTDEDGNKIKAVGLDGAVGPQGPQGEQGPQGPQGEPGKDAVAPQLKIGDDGKWYISVDGGQTWDYIAPATGDKGETGPQGPQGEQGPQGDKGDKGDKGDSFFQDVDCTSDPSYIIITLTDGTQIKLPTWYAFEALQTQVTSNVEALQTIVNALQNNDCVTGVKPIYEDGKVIGYTISFSKSGDVVIYHGQDGKDGVDGAPGQDGTDGEDGKDGADGHTPVIGVAKHTDGIYYWTVNGKWLEDEAGNKIKAVGTDGQNGSDGQDGAAGAPGPDGKDGVTPQLKIEAGKWYVSYDNGASWIEIGQATGDEGPQGPQGPEGSQGPQGPEGEQGPQGEPGKDGDSFFQGVDASDPDYVILTLADGTVIQLPKYKEMSIRFYDEASNELAGPMAFQPGAERTITYEAQGSGELKVAVLASNGWIAIISRKDDRTGSIRIVAPQVYVETEVVVLVSQGASTMMETVAFLQPPVSVGADHDGFTNDSGSSSDIW